ncbi:MAG: B12-binding domain-containing radical SAM protein [Nitrospirae bacterium]|nr:B12-binding domain-containing radical SAM protein [Nitrospirota bacterium]
MKRILFVGAVDPYSQEETHLRPLWPACLAAYAENKFGEGAFEFRFVNGRIEEGIKAFQPDFVAISTVTKNYPNAVQSAVIAKQHKLPVVIGGMHITTVPGCLDKNMDAGCIGEGEQTFAELLQIYLETGSLQPARLAGVKGIVYRKNGELTINEKRQPLPDMDQMPHPKRSVVGYGNRDYLYTARGCSSNCVFCSCTRHWGTVRYASPEYVLEEVRELIENGVKIIRFNEDNFASNHPRLRRISELIVENGFHRKARFSCWCRANFVTPDVAKSLKAMNVVSVKMGLESGCDKTLKFLKGGVTVKDNWNAVNLLKDAGMQVNADFIIGAPEETREEMMQTYDFIKKSRVDFVDVNVLTPLPGTPLYDYAVAKKLITDDTDWSNINFSSQKEYRGPILSETIDREQLKAIYDKFRRLRLYKTLKAVPRSPWLGEIPGILVRRVLGKAVKTVRQMIR